MRMSAATRQLRGRRRAGPPPSFRRVAVREAHIAIGRSHWWLYGDGLTPTDGLWSSPQGFWVSVRERYRAALAAVLQLFSAWSSQRRSHSFLRRLTSSQYICILMLPIKFMSNLMTTMTKICYNKIIFHLLHNAEWEKYSKKLFVNITHNYLKWKLNDKRAASV